MTFRLDVMYAVAPWKRREVARNGGVQYASRDSKGWSATVKDRARRERRAADKRETGAAT